MIGSTMLPGMVTYPSAPRARVTVWARVKAVICISSGRSFVDRKNKPTTNRM